ncbi:MAG: response regulator, partial [Okeania sp. SIO3C4]|nr:response regulator [Okeania sp. SIO3C4]
SREGQVSFRVSKTEDHKISFSIQDTGVGIPENKLEEIFESFHQIGELKDRAEGTGLGLAISRALVRMMGGELRVKSKVDRGSTFYFALAMPITDTIDTKSKSSKYKSTQGYIGDRRRVLIADDNFNNRSVLNDILLPLGFQIDIALNGEEAVEMALHENYDVILMDIVMPKKNGFEATKEIKKKLKDKSPKVIAISASVEQSIIDNATLIGCDSFLPKPVDIDLLLDELEDKLSIEWVMKKKTKENTQDIKDIMFPKQQILEELSSAAVLGKITHIKRILKELKLSENYVPFTSELEKYLAAYDFDSIVEFIEKRKDF